MYPEQIKKVGMERFQMDVICVLGVGCVGKSTYCKSLCNEIGNGEPKSILLQPGKVLREALGESFFLQFAESGSPEATDRWVKSLFTDAVILGMEYKMHLVVDGFPRNERQIIWMLTSSMAQNYNVKFDFRFLHCNADVLHERIESRIKTHSNPEVEKQLIQRRNQYEVQHVIALQKCVRDAQSRFKSNITISNIEV